MNKSITAILNEYLPKTQQEPRLLLKSNRRLVQLYTNYPCTSGISAEICAAHFNENPFGIVGFARDGFVNFTLDAAFMERQISALAKNFTAVSETLPDQNMAAYLGYVISVIAKEFGAGMPDAPYTNEETELCIWTLFLSEQSYENRQKRKDEFITRLSALLNTYIRSRLSPKQKQLLLAAAAVLSLPI